MDDLLTLVQWLSPAYPVGGFAYSHGLEQAVRDGRVGDAPTLTDWLDDILHHGAARNDAIWLRLAHASPDPAALNAEARAFAASRERLAEAAGQGRAFVAVTNAVWALDLPDLLLPLAVGCAAGRKGIDADTAAALYLQSFVSNQVQAAMRLMPLGQVAGQGVAARLQPVCRSVAAGTRNATPDDIASTAFLSDIAAMRHETLRPRIFQT